ncbi:hypothetical protein H8S95_14450 [Pontibacter sp. KCTC 32443]|uniref:hypothetical protein n=1 Tax=Pontibacter TaxID=323449 RepID=UPI00164D6107|nr:MULTISPECIES: hypothetical protein [Pontibacter]MBC5775276.1 hypothetical protein [Pontibacter sp. KCTC 32443]
MNIEIDNKEVIPLRDFKLTWRWEKTHNPEITETEKVQIEPVSEAESKRLNKIIDFFEKEDNLNMSFIPTDWISASSENNEKIEQFRSKLTSIIEQWDERVIVTWDRTTTLRTSKEIFLKYWDDFCYPSSDDVTIISEKTNWVMFYNHIGIAKIWTKEKNEHTTKPIS